MFVFPHTLDKGTADAKPGADAGWDAKTLLRRT
jgi:hypothetical protein